MGTTTKGRGFLAMEAGERKAFGAWLRDQINEAGGRALVSNRTGISPDSLSKWSGGRAIPSKLNMDKLIQMDVIPAGWETREQLIAASPWMDKKYRKAPALNQEVVAPAEPEPQNLMTAIMDEPGLSAKQRATLAAVVALVANGIELDIQLSPSRRR